MNSQSHMHPNLWLLISIAILLSALPLRAQTIAINEFLASNHVTIADQDGEFDDWIELFNYGPEAVVLAGLFLSDDEDDPQQWAIPDTLLGSGEFLLVWADDDEDQSGLHANFKLSNEGETVILSAMDGTAIDQLIFGPQREDVSYGRYPDGTGVFREMYPTPGLPNVDDAPPVEPEITVFGDAIIHTINLQFYVAAWQDSLRYNFEVLDKEYMPALLTFDGELLDSIGVRYKGNSSYTLSSNTPKKPFQFKFDKYLSDQTLGGFSRLNVQNGVSDPSFMRETIAYGIARSILPASRTAYANVFVNDTLLGFYVLVEEIDKVFLADHFTDNSGNLFKAGNNGATMQWYGSDPTLYADEFELKTNEDENDWTDFITLLDSLNNVTDDRFIAALDPLLDMDACLRAFAFNMVLSSFDSYTGSGRNFYFYQDPASGKFTFLPWDVNESFGVYSNGWDVIEQDIFVTGNEAQRPLLRRLIAVDSLRDVYSNYVMQLLNGPAHPDSITAMTAILQPLLGAYVTADPNKLYTDAQFFSNSEEDVFVDIGRRIPGLNSFAESRARSIRLQLTTDFVYPGDTNNDGIVDAQDILPIGVYFLSAGTSRLTESLEWSPQPALLWNEPAAAYADANGDGTVDEQDVVAIGINWNNTHESAACSYRIDPTDDMLLAVHQPAFELLYESLQGSSAAVREMKTLLETVLDMPASTVYDFELHQNYPNPFNGATEITFILPETAQVTLRVTDILGRLVAEPVSNMNYLEGVHRLSLSLNDIPSGVYFYRLEANEFSAVRKMVMIR